MPPFCSEGTNASGGLRKTNSMRGSAVVTMSTAQQIATTTKKHNQAMITKEEKKKKTKSRQLLSPVDRVITVLKRREPERVVDLFAEYPPCELDCWATDDDGRTLLHRVMSFRPSPPVVDLIISRMTSSSSGSCSQLHQQRVRPEDATDRYGMTPLHIAAASGASIDVVERLLRGTVGSSALATDSMNRLPLHWACCNPSGLSPQMPRQGLFPACGATRRDSDNMLAIVQKLIKVYPQAVWMVDRDGATPFDLAAARRADTTMLVLLDITMKKTETKQRDTTEYSNTDLDSSLDIPWEVSESFDPDADDMSTIGTGGVSRRRHKQRSSKRVSGGLTEEERSRIHIYL
jgi:Ankyrin repeats (3 copies)